MLIARGANLPIVARLLQQMRGFARVMRLGRIQPPEHLLEVQAEHEAIADALELRDAELAERELHAHLHHWDRLLLGDPEAERYSLNCARRRSSSVTPRPGPVRHRQAATLERQREQTVVGRLEQRGRAARSR